MEKVEEDECAQAHFFIAEERMSNGNKGALVQRITEIAERVGRAEGLEIVELELLGGGASRLLRIYIDKQGGVTHADCELTSQKVGALLDEEDVVPGGGYTLEVSSPGVERKLTKPADFERFSGQKAKLVLSEAVDDQKHLVGTLRGMEGSVVRIESSDGRLIQVPLANVRKANLKFDW